MSNIEKQIQKWAEDAAKTYNDLGLNYYSQSPLINLRPNPILICGINPGSNGKFEEHDVLYIINGNPTWSEHKKWGYWKNLKQYFRYNPDLLEDGHYVLTNLSFCATKKAHDISKETLKASLQTTLDLIDILQPKRIVLLSGKMAFSLLEEATDKIKHITVINEDLNYGEISEIPVLGVAHPSARFQTGGRKKVAQAINAFISDDYSIERIRNAYGICRIPFSANDVVAELNACGMNAYEISKDNKTHRYDIGNRLQLTITSTQGGYVGIRLKDFIITDDGTKSFVPKDKASKLSIPSGWITNKYWIAMKTFRNFYSVEECLSEIMSIIK